MWSYHQTHRATITDDDSPHQATPFLLPNSLPQTLCSPKGPELTRDRYWWGERRFPPPMEGFPAWGISELRKGRSFSVKWNLKHQKFKISNGYPVKARPPGHCWLHFIGCLNLGLSGWGWPTPQSIMNNKIWGERKGNQQKIVPPLLFRGLAIVEKDIICTLALLG